MLLAQEQSKDGKPVPNGQLRPLPDVPRFASALEARRWVQASGDKLSGMTVFVVRMMHKLKVFVEAKPAVKVFEDTRYTREGCGEE